MTRRGAPPEIALSADEARRTALAAQGLLDARPARPATARDVLRVIERVRLLQIDSINVLVRAHYLPLFSRLGPYDRAILDRLTYEKRALYEAWAHAATILPTRFHRLLRWRSERRPWRDIERIERERPGYVEEVRRRIEADGPTAVSDLPGETAKGSWWGWADGKHVLEWLFATGRVVACARRNFERVYDLAHRVLPREHLDADAPAPDAAKKALLLESADALGVATVRDLADYFRLHVPTARALVGELVEEGRLRRVRVEGWEAPAFATTGLRVPRRESAARALLSPFDSLLFQRARAERLFSMRYRIEVYTPERKRVYGYYVLPFLLDGEIVARVDLKADRAAGRLLVRAAHKEAEADGRAVVEPLAHELFELARWLDLGSVVVERRGGLSARLGAAVRARSRRPTRPSRPSRHRRVAGLQRLPL